MIDLIINRNHDKSFGFGITTYIHSHFYDGDKFTTPWHFHILLNFAFWFLEIQIGRDVPKGE
ncbi:MAG: hypothetical protein PQJ59_16605 [Spirochaetales bacterium]|nr:hypothetical protein [Spirochaetales bacterium]